MLTPENKARAVAEVQERLKAKFPDLDLTLVETAVQHSHAEFTHLTLRDLIPVLVENRARRELQTSAQVRS